MNRSKRRKRSNKPGTGSILRVDPIRSPEAIEAIKTLLREQPRNLLLFVLGINTNLRMCDLLAIRLGQVRGLKVGEVLLVRERKTKKLRRITINRTVDEALQGWLPHCDHLAHDDVLFWSRKTSKALSVPSVNHLIKSWCDEVGLKGHYGCHTPRKTFGYMHRKYFGTDLPTLMCLFNHSNQKMTLGYLGIDEDEITEAFMREI